MKTEDKLKLYKQGKYRMKVPPVTTNLWDTGDWLAFIDTHGQWLPDCEEIEFKVGDVVTFCAYTSQLHQDLVCTVLAVIPENKYLNGETDKRVRYSLTGAAYSTATGASIQESRYFSPVNDEVALRL